MRSGRRWRLTEPLGYLDFLRLMSSARLVMTDSGGIQEECTVLGVPCLTLRSNTERPATLASGWNRLVGTDPDQVRAAADEVLDAPSFDEVAAEPPELWDGRAGERLVDILRQLDGPGLLEVAARRELPAGRRDEDSPRAVADVGWNARQTSATRTRRGSPRARRPNLIG
jgi:hypothetical protein